MPLPIVIVPVKQLTAAKTRLPIQDRVLHIELCLAMVCDVVEAAVASGAQVLVVTDDPSVSGEITALGATAVPDPGGGLDAAVSRVARPLTEPVAVIMADLPCLRAADLTELWLASAGVPRWVVADSEGSGTCALGAVRGDQLLASYGPGSRQRHALTAIDLSATASPRLRCDIDAATDLQAALRLGVGRHSAGLLAQAWHLVGPAVDAAHGSRS